eukprot:626103-Amphidinium_carterae.1
MPLLTTKDLDCSSTFGLSHVLTPILQRRIFWFRNLLICRGNSGITVRGNSGITVLLQLQV